MQIKTKEKQTHKITLDLKDDAGVALTTAAINAVTCDLFNLDDGDQTAIGGLSAADVWASGSGDEGFTWADGLLTWVMETDQNTILDQTKHIERHKAEIVITYSTSKSLKIDLEILVEGFQKVT